MHLYKIKVPTIGRQIKGDMNKAKKIQELFNKNHGSAERCWQASVTWWKRAARS